MLIFVRLKIQEGKRVFTGRRWSLLVLAYFEAVGNEEEEFGVSVDDGLLGEEGLGGFLY